ncbi:hypothetical protein RB195_013059 [Necator americanus]|uniref:Uncharacterized protein n=1 Tax=Necator americanus TaxID=51031 RepID=A0ABR1DTU1_NECAM
MNEAVPIVALQNSQNFSNICPSLSIFQKTLDRLGGDRHRAELMCSRFCTDRAAESAQLDFVAQGPCQNVTHETCKHFGWGWKTWKWTGRDLELRMFSEERPSKKKRFGSSTR